MRLKVTMIVLVQTALVVAFAVALRSSRMPLGVPGEWEWIRVKTVTPWFGVLFASAAVVVYTAIVALGMRAMRGGPSRGREACWVIVLFVGGFAAQVILPSGAPDEYDLTRWAYVPFVSGSTGYYTVGRREIRDPWRFLADYPAWIAQQDSLHIGTHPPGLFLVEYGLVRLMEERPGMTRVVLDYAPGPVREGLRYLGKTENFPVPDRAALAVSSALTCLACAATVIPLFLLARATLSAAGAWASAALWAFVPSANLYQPVADTAFPFLSTTALMLAVHAGRRGSWGGLLLAAGAGLVLALGTQLTLAFFPVGLIVGIVLAATSSSTMSRRAALIAATGAGFLAFTLGFWVLTRANPFVIWWWNQKNHARFYVEFPRTYWAWVLVNPIEFAIGIGIPSAVWIVVGLSGSFAGKLGKTSLSTAAATPPGTWAAGVSWATLLVLILLNFSGKNLSETPRLWLPMMPALLVAVGAAMQRLEVRPIALAVCVALLGVETMVLEAMIQVVYPV